MELFVSRTRTHTHAFARKIIRDIDLCVGQSEQIPSFATVNLLISISAPATRAAPVAGKNDHFFANRNMIRTLYKHSMPKYRIAGSVQQFPSCMVSVCTCSQCSIPAELENVCRQQWPVQAATALPHAHTFQACGTCSMA